MSILNTLHVCKLGHFSHVQLFVTLRAYQCLLSMGFSSQEYWSGLPRPPPGDPPDPGIQPKSFMSPDWQAGFFTDSSTWETQHSTQYSKY